MPIGVDADRRDLATSLRGWAAGLDGPALVRAAEEVADAGFDAGFDEAWPEVVKQGIPTIAVAEALGGGGGGVLDLAVALEACAHELVPGPLLGTSVAATLAGWAGAGEPIGEIAGGVPCGVALEPSLALGSRLTGRAVVYDAVPGGRLLLGAGDGWLLVPASLVSISPAVGVDLSRRTARVEVDLAADHPEVVPLPGVTGEAVRGLLVTLAAAEAAGIAARCLATAVEHARTREQFGRPIGGFQAVKHLCAGMLETAESVAAAAWDAASAAPEDQWGYAVDVAGAIALDGAVRVAEDCIQVLGGIGFTFEHDAHLYLRRAIALRGLLGRGDRYAVRLARRAVAGERRRLRVDLDGRDEGVRERVRDEVAAIAARSAEERRSALVDTGYLVPHWPAPYGLDASAVEQLVIDEELDAAGVERPDLAIAGWALPTILRHGSDAQRERFVRPTLLGEIVWCQLFSEPGAGSDLASLTTRAERVDGGWRLQGQKVWTSVAAQADWAICLARTGAPDSRHRGITYFLVDMRTPGIEVRPLREMTGDALFNEVFLDGVAVPDECVVGEVDGGWALARTTLANERVAMASARLDAGVERAIALVDETSEADLARVGHAVALSTVCGLLGARSTLKAIAGEGPGAESSVAKLLGVRSRQDAAELAVDLSGPAVLLGDDPAVRDDVHEMLLTRCLSIAGGTTQILRNVAAERILGLPR